MGKANQGKAFEDLINYAVAMELQRSSGALIFKVPTPWKVQRRFNPYTGKREIAAAFPEMKSTVDYIGIFRGRALAFEAKSTENKGAFPLSNIEQHQKEFLHDWQQRGGTAFFLIHFSLYNQTFFVTFDQIAAFEINNKRRSITLEWFVTNAIELKEPIRLFKELAELNLI
jgi:recombination protein U